MKKLLATILALSMTMSLTACGSKDNETSSSSENGNISSASDTNSDTAPVDEEDVKVSLTTSEMSAELDEILVSLLKDKGIDVNYTTELIEFSAPQSVLNEVASAYRTAINDKGKEAGGTIVSMEIKEDYSDITFRVTSDFENSMDALALLIFAQPVYEMQLMTGKTDDTFGFTETVIDNDSGEVIQTAKVPEDLG